MNMQGSLNPEATEALIADFRATRVNFTTWGTKRALGDEHKDIAAAAFSADAEFMGASKKLINTKAKSYRKVTSLKSRIARLWKDCTLDYPEDGIRLIKECDVNKFHADISCERMNLLDAVDELDAEYNGLKVEARLKLGTLYNEADYPYSLKGLFDVAWDFPNVQPPDYLRTLNPGLYEQERRRIVAKFDEAVTLAEQAFIAEFEGLVSHVAERLTGTNEDGKPKVFRDTTIENLTEFFAKFGHLSVRSNDQLDALVKEAQDLVKGVKPADLKADGGQVTPMQEQLRAYVAGTMSGIGEQLAGMMIDKPKRKIVKPKSPAAV